MTRRSARLHRRRRWRHSRHVFRQRQPLPRMPLPVLVVAVLLTVAALALQGTRGSKSGSENVAATGPQLAAYSVNAREVAIDQAEAAAVPLTDGVVAGASAVVAPPSSAAPAQELAAPATAAVKVAAPPTSSRTVAATTATTAAATTAAPITAATTTTVAETTTTVAPATSVVDLALPPAGAQSLGEFTVVCYVIVGTTYSGEPTGPNVVAVDKSVIPLHTNLWIDGGVGYRTALDIGGGVKGNTLDLWMTWPDCKKFGKQHLTVYKVG
jgi:3D (Asp-Asp-Asp) domain-containing protein